MTNIDAGQRAVPMLEHRQGLPTSGARAVAPFRVGGDLCLAVPQLAKDVPGTPAHLNGGDSGLPMAMFRWRKDRFVAEAPLPVHGGEDAEFFHIGDRAFLAIASIREGSGPYDLDVDSVIFEWSGTAFEPFQAVPTFAAKQWRHFQIGDRHFLALAQGVTMDGVTPKNPAQSMILEWDGAGFRPFQTVVSAWGYNWSHFQIDGHDFLAYADHRVPSIIMRWDGTGFATFQTLDGDSGRAFCFFEADGERFLAFANLLGDTLLYRWDGERFARHQVLSGPGGREFAFLSDGGESYLIQVNFLTGTPQAPETALRSVIYRMSEGKLVVADTFATFGATDVAAFKVGNETFVAVAESLSKEVRFRTDSRIYAFRGAGAATEEVG